MLAVSRPKANRKRKADQFRPGTKIRSSCSCCTSAASSTSITTRAVWQSPKLKQLSATERHYQLQDRDHQRARHPARPRLRHRRPRSRHPRAHGDQSQAAGTHARRPSPRSTRSKRFLTAINARGHNMTTLNKRAVAQVLANKPDDYVRQLLELRRTGARAASTSSSACWPMRRRPTIACAARCACMAPVPDAGPGSVRSCRT